MPHPKTCIVWFQPPPTHCFQSPIYLLRSVTQGAPLGPVTHPLLPSARATCSPHQGSARPQQLVTPILNNYRGSACAHCSLRLQFSPTGIKHLEQNLVFNACAPSATGGSPFWCPESPSSFSPLAFVLSVPSACPHFHFFSF